MITLLVTWLVLSIPLGLLVGRAIDILGGPDV